MRETCGILSLSWRKSLVHPRLYRPFTRKNGNLKAIRKMYPPMEKVVISVDTTNNLSETAQKRTVTSDPLPEQEVFRGPMETWPIKKSQVLTKAREKVKRCREKLEAPVKHLELIEQVMPTEGKQIKKGPLRTSNPTSIQPDLEDVFRRSLHKGWSRRRSCAHSSRRRKDHDLTQIVIRGHQQRF